MSEMVRLTKLNGERVAVNADQILYVHTTTELDRVKYTELVFGGISRGAALKVVESVDEVYRDIEAARKWKAVTDE